MGRCAKRTKKIIKAFARELTPIGVRLIGDAVGLASTTDWSNDEKRENAVAMARGAIKSRGLEAKETAIRAAVEMSVAALKQGQEALSELGKPDEEDAAEIATPD